MERTVNEENIQNNENSNLIQSFQDLGLCESILKALAEMGYEKPTEVQAAAIPLATVGQDLIVQSRTGSGKTAAFGIPMADRLVDTEQAVTQALVLSPTRELALQVSRELTQLGRYRGMTVCAVYGGAPMGPQVRALEQGVHVVVGTPGRVLDHLRRRTFKTEGIKLLVLDEGDEMLSMGFYEEISAIIDHLPTERQTMLFSATFPDEIQKIADRHLRQPQRLQLSEDFIGVREIEHLYYLVSGGNRVKDLLRILELESPELALIFCNTRDDTAMVAEVLRQQGFKAEGISSDLTQNDREQVMDRMRRGELRYLVATDVAARGIDLVNVTHVFNYTFPEAADIYIHRTGRTGRAGRSGRAVSLVSPREIGSFYYLKLIHKIHPEERRLPSSQEVAARKEGERLQQFLALLENKEPSEELRSLARRVGSMVDAERLTALALAVVLKEYDQLRQASPARPASLAPSRSEPRGEVEQDQDAPQRSRTRQVESRSDRPRRPGRAPMGGDRGRGRDRDRDRDRDRRPEPVVDRAPENQDVGSPEPAGPRKTRRSHRSAPAEQDTFAMPNGDVEFFEIVDEETQAIPRGPVKLYLNIGRRQGVRASDLVDYLCQEAGVEAQALADLQLRDTHTYLTVPDASAQSIIDRVSGKAFHDRVLKIERAKH